MSLKQKINKSMFTKLVSCRLTTWLKIQRTLTLLNFENLTLRFTGQNLALKKIAFTQRAVLRDGGRNSSEILFIFAALALVRVAVKPATSQSRFYVMCKRATA
jgi:hypothetical protein